MAEPTDITNMGSKPNSADLIGAGATDYVRSLEIYLQLLQREIEHLRSKEIPIEVQEKTSENNIFNLQINQSRFYNCNNLIELANLFEEFITDITNPIETSFYLLGSDKKIVFPAILANEPAITEITRKLEEEGLIDWAVEKKDLSVIPNFYEDTPDSQTNIILIPLYLKENPIGLIVSKSGKKDELTTEESGLISVIADYAKFALDNIRSADEIKKMNSRLSAMNTQINRTTSFATLGELTASILKEIDIPVDIIKSNIGFIESGFGDTQRRIEIIKDQLSQLSEKTNKLSELFKTTELDSTAKPVKLSSVLEEVLLFTNSQLTRDGIIAEKVIEEPGAEIIAEKTRLEQALLSLVIFMRDNLPDGGILRFGIFRQSNRRVVFSVAYYGSGYNANISEKMFEPTSVNWNPNLQLLKATVDSLNGKIEIITEPGKGTTFKLIFPVNKF